MRDRGVLSLKKALPRMSWSPKNLMNIWRRTVDSQNTDDLHFRLTAESTLFQQRWKSKKLMRAYHGDFIPEKIFKRWYLPETLPDVRPQRHTAPVTDDAAELQEFARRKQREKGFAAEIEEKGMAPVGSLMMAEVERRIDVFIFRCCFVHSVYEARRLVIHGDVLLNGKKHTDANTRLAPGDMVTVNPDAIRFFKKYHTEHDNVIERYFDKNGNKKIVGAAKLIAEAKAERAEAEAEALGKDQSPESAAAESEQLESSSSSEEVQGATEDAAATISTTTDGDATTSPSHALTPFSLPLYASPHLFIPAYIEPSFSTCSAVYVRHPTARPGYSEIPTPYDADGALIRYAWEWYVQRRPRLRSKSQLARMPQDRARKQREELEVVQGHKRDLKADIERFKRAMKLAKGSAAGGSRRKAPAVV